MSLKDAIAQWDGKSASDIKNTFDEYRNEVDFLTSIIDYLACPELEKGASWLLKAWLESTKHCAAQDARKICQSLEKLSYWESQLHVLQSMPYMPIPKSSRKTIEIFVRKTLAANNKFVRAWSYNAFYCLATEFPEYQEEASTLFTMAMRDEAASVKARVRKLIKAGW